MDPNQPLGQFTYFAFISYKHADGKWADWLQRSLQSYRLPQKTHKRYPELPLRLTPVFLDKTNLTPGILDEGLKNEVQASRFLIVICSRQAHAASKYLDDEIQYFIDGGGDASRIIPFIVDDSPAPEEDCFPKRLQELCETATILGANIFESGKRNAFLKVVAYMHGIKLAEIESDDDRRRKTFRRTLAAGIGGFLLIAGILGYRFWDYYVPKTRYYLDYVERYGVPEGVHELTESEIRAMNGHYTLISREGRVREILHEDSRGRLTVPPYDASRPAHAAYEYTENGDLERVTCYDTEDSPSLVMDYYGSKYADLRKYTEDGADSFGAAVALPAHTALSSGNLFEGSNSTALRSSIVRYLFIYDENGFLKELRYVGDPAYNHIAVDADGIAGLRYERDELGRALKQYYLSYTGTGLSAEEAENYAVIGTRQGLFGMSYLYDGEDDLCEVSYISADGKPVMSKDNGYARLLRAFEDHNCTEISYYDGSGAYTSCREGYACMKAAYDDYGDPIREEYVNGENSPVLSTYGYAAAEYAYDEKGNRTETIFYGTEGERIVSAYSGYCRERDEYDSGGNLTGCRFYDEEDVPVFCNNGFAGYEKAYNENGKTEKITYLGTDGKPVIMKEGYASCVFSYDTGGRVVKRQYFDAEDKPLLQEQGYAEIRTEYDERGNIASSGYYGADGKPVICADWTAGVSFSYDDRGNIIRKSFYGTDGEPVLCAAGWASLSAEYDGLGNMILRTYYGKDGEIKEADDGHAVVAWEYDDRGFLLKESFLKDDGSLTMGREGFAFHTRAYDERGNAVREDFFDKEGNPVIIGEGYAGAEYGYDERGNQISQRFFGTDGQPILNADGYAGVNSLYDEKGNPTERTFLGTDGKPAPYVHGYARVVFSYDERGNAASASYFDASGNPVISDEGIFSYKREYDERGYLKKESFFDSDGELMNGRDGYAFHIREYDERGNAVRESFYDSDGNLTLFFDGYASACLTYDERGRQTETEYYGTDGNLILNRFGYCEVSYVYDEQGHIISEEYRGTDGQPVFTSMGYASCRSVYDENGRLEERLYYDESGAEIDTEFGMRSCMIAFPAGENREGYRKLSELFVIMKLGDWEYGKYTDSQSMVEAFLEAVNLSAENPAEVLYLQYIEETDQYILFKDIFQKGTMGLLMDEREVSETQYRKLLKAMDQAPVEGNIRGKSTVPAA
ncbi:MAG: TIR domain-containing protein [Lachnospiraceae bacterium]|nr:TIR domain-containing protein [Lachnospiraceae bacterium]